MTISAVFCAYDKPGIVGGTSSWIQRLLPALADHGITAKCLVFLHTGEKGPVSAELESRGVPCSFTPAHRYTEDRISWIVDEINSVPCDVFIPNEVPAAYHAARWIREAGIPTVGILHTDGDAASAMLSTFVFGDDHNALDRLVCVSRNLEKRVIERGPAHTKVARIPYGAEVPDRSVMMPRSRFRVAYAGRLAEEQKRISSVVIALCNAARRIPDIEAFIYGDGPEAGEVTRLLEAQGDSLPVRYGGSLEVRALREKFLETHATVLLSDYEGLPVTLMEAMACGCVPVCFPTASGIPELVEHGVTGLLVADREDAVVAAIARLQGDHEEWQSLSLGARARIESEYTHDAAAEAWAKLISDTARPGAARAPVTLPRRLALPAPVQPFEWQRERKPPQSTIDHLRSTKAAAVLRPYWRALLRKKEERRRRRERIAAFWQLSEADRARTALFSQFVKRGGLVFDVGANHGHYSKVFIGLGAKVVAVEPQDRCIANLREVFAGHRRFALVSQALGAASGEAEMLVSNVSALSSLSLEHVRRTRERFHSGINWDERQTVRVTTLDDLIARHGRPDFLKIDVEGYELEVLRGLTQPVKCLSIEFTAECIEKTFDALDYLASLGPFEGQVLFDDSMEWKLEKWERPEQIRISLGQLVERHRLCIGDVYLRHVPPASPDVPG